MTSSRRVLGEATFAAAGTAAFVSNTAHIAHVPPTTVPTPGGTHAAATATSTMLYSTFFRVTSEFINPPLGEKKRAAAKSLRVGMQRGQLASRASKCRVRAERGAEQGIGFYGVALIVAREAPLKIEIVRPRRRVAGLNRSFGL